jgi:polyhydroxybutyrate depolymerase
MHRPPSVLVLALVAVWLVPSCVDRAETGAPTTTSGETSGVCVPPPVDPAEPQVLRSGGQERRYLLSVPDTAPGDEGFPLVVSLHGHGSSAPEHEANTSLAARGRERGFVVATPEGLGEPRRWNFDRRADGPDDYAFVTRLLDDLVRRACVDTTRIYVAGSSNGAAFAGLLACTEPARVAAVAMVIATVPPTCPEGVTPPVLTIRVTADATVPYDNAPALVAGWAEHNACVTPPREDEPPPGATRTTYDGCADDGQVVLVTVAGGVHAWPGSVGADRPDNSEAGIDFSATDEVLAFFTSGGPAS